MKIQPREELIKIIASYYFNINSLFSHSCRCMPSCDDCGPTKWGNGEDWGSVLLSGVSESPGKGQVTMAEHPPAPAWHQCVRLGLWIRCWGAWCKSASSVHPPSLWPKGSLCPSAAREQLWLLCWAPLLGSRAWGSAVGPGPLCPPAEPPCDLLLVTGRYTVENNTLKMWLRPPTVITKATVELLGTAFGQHQSELWI